MMQQMFGQNPKQGPAWIEALGRVQLLGIGWRVKASYFKWLANRYNRTWDSRTHEARKAFEHNRPALSDVQRRAVDSLVREGFAAVHFDDLIGEPGLWNRLAGAVSIWLNSDAVQSQEQEYKNGRHRDQQWKEYLIRWYGNKTVISADSPWLELGLRNEILDIVTSYMGMWPLLNYVDLWDTIALEHDGPLTGSQRWHRDPEDKKLVKVFLYFSDVDESSGPLHYVPNSRPGDKYGQLWPQKPPQGSVPPPEEFERQIPRSEWMVCTHSAGTLVFVDTSGFHMGGRATKKNRVFATWSYVSPASLWPRRFVVDPPEAVERWSARAKHALS